MVRLYIVTAVHCQIDLVVGPIIRISPWELHIDDPDYYEELYSLQQPRNRYGWFVAQFGLPDSIFAAVDHRLHRSRRAAMSPFFSKASTNKLEPMIGYMIEKFCGRINQYRKSGQPLPMRNLYSCLTTDVITLYAMNRSWNYLDSPDLSAFWVETMENLVKFGAIAKYFPWVMKGVEALPIEVLRKLDPGTAMIFDFRKVCVFHLVASPSRWSANKRTESSRQHSRSNRWNLQVYTGTARPRD